MGRLHAILLHTPDLARQRAWYGVQLGLTPADAADPDTFATRGAALALRASDAPAIELVIAVRGLTARVASMRARGIEVTHADGSTEAQVLDPDANRLRLIEDAAPATGKWPALSHVIVNTPDLARAGHFYRDALGLKLADDTGVFLEMESGDCRLMLHDESDTLGLALHADQRVAFALSDDDLDKWAEELRGREVSFVTAPMDEEIGRMAEVEDADGWFVVLRGPGTDLGREEELAAEYDDEGSMHSGGARRSLDPGDSSQRPAFGSRKLVKRRVERVATKGFEQLNRGRDDAKGSDLPSLPRTGGSFGAPRPGGFSGPRPPFTGPRPDRPAFTGPRPDRPGFSGPRPSGPGTGPSRPSGPGFGGPRPGGPSGPRPPYTGPRPDRGSSGPPRSDAPRSAPRPDGPRPAPRRPPEPPRDRE